MLTDKQCKNALCTEGKVRVRLADASGLYLEVASSGSKRWFWKYRFDGKEKRLAIGGYPDVGTTYNSGATCATLVNRLLGGPPPVAAANCTGVTVPLRTEYSGGACQVQACPTDFPTAIVLSATSAL